MKRIFSDRWRVAGIIVLLLACGGFFWWRMTRSALLQVAVIRAGAVQTAEAGFLVSDLHGTFSLHDWQSGKVCWSVTAASPSPSVPWGNTLNCTHVRGELRSRFSLSPDGHYLAAASVQQSGVRMQVWHDGQQVSDVRVPDRQATGVRYDITITNGGQVYLMRATSTTLPRVLTRRNAFTISLYEHGRRIAGNHTAAYLAAVGDGLPLFNDVDEYRVTKRGTRLIPVTHVIGVHPPVTPSYCTGWTPFLQYEHAANASWILQYDGRSTCYTYQPSTKDGWMFPFPEQERRLPHIITTPLDITPDGRAVLLHLPQSRKSLPLTDFLQRKLPFLRIKRGQTNSRAFYIYERPGTLRAHGTVAETRTPRFFAYPASGQLSPDRNRLLVEMYGDGETGMLQVILYRW